MKNILLRSAVLGLLAFSTANAAPAVEIPSGDYKLDKSHASLVFSVNHLGFSNYTAQFKTFDANLKLDVKNPEKSSLDVTVDIKSLAIPTPPAGFVEELLGAKWLNAKTHPQVTFKSTKIEVLEGNKAKIAGDLTLNGITKPITLDAVFNGGWKGLPKMDPNARAGFSAKGSFKRSDFGIAEGIPQPGTNMGVGDEITVAIETEFTGPALAEK